MASWRLCKPHQISADDVVELIRLAKIEPEDIAKTDRWQGLAKVMRAACTVPGDDWHRFFAVWRPVGWKVKEHQHREHTMLFYPEACDPISIEGVPLHLDKGTVLHINPWTPHSVEPVSAERITIAMLVKDAKTPSPE